MLCLEFAYCTRWQAYHTFEGVVERRFGSVADAFVNQSERVRGLAQFTVCEMHAQPGEILRYQ